jgi:hypothetical protein
VIGCWQLQSCASPALLLLETVAELEQCCIARREAGPSTGSLYTRAAAGAMAGCEDVCPKTLWSLGFVPSVALPGDGGFLSRCIPCSAAVGAVFGGNGGQRGRWRF